MISAADMMPGGGLQWQWTRGIRTSPGSNPARRPNTDRAINAPSLHIHTCAHCAVLRVLLFRT